MSTKFLVSFTDRDVLPKRLDKFLVNSSRKVIKLVKLVKFFFFFFVSAFVVSLPLFDE